MEQANVNLKICVFGATKQKIINIEDFSGIDTPIEAFGFDAKGNPITNPEMHSHIVYKITGGMSGGVNLNNVFHRGLFPDNVKDAKKKLFGFDAVCLQLGRNGCAANVEEIRKATENLIKSGIGRVHYFREANINGMSQSYGMFKDEWIVSGDVPTVNYDTFNKLLKKIGSPWRIQTPNTLKLLRKLELERLTAETSEL